MRTRRALIVGICAAKRSCFDPWSGLIAITSKLGRRRFAFRINIWPLAARSISTEATIASVGSPPLISRSGAGAWTAAGLYFLQKRL
jgi:hypothetical protein